MRSISKNILIILSILVSANLVSTAFADDYTESESQSLKYKEASFYGQHGGQRGIEVGIAIFGKKDQKRILGKKVSGYLTYDVAITNSSAFRIHVNSIEILNPKDKSPIKNEELDGVYKKMGLRGNGNKENLRSSIVRHNFLNKSLQNKIIEPGDTVQGILFIKSKKIKNHAILKIKIQNLKKLAYLDIEVPFEK